MKVPTGVFVMWLVAVHITFAADSIVQIDDRAFTNATITSDGVRVKIVSPTGIETIPLAQMSHEDQVKWGYNPGNAAIRSQQEAASEETLKAELSKSKAIQDAQNAERAKQLAAAHRTYVVRKGDTWQSITLSFYGTRSALAWGRIYDVNGVSPDALKVGQQLVIPIDEKPPGQKKAEKPAHTFTGILEAFGAHTITIPCASGCYYSTPTG